MSLKLSGNGRGRLWHGMIAVIAVLAAEPRFIALAQAESPVGPGRNRQRLRHSMPGRRTMSRSRCCLRGNIWCKRGDTCGSGAAAGACDDAECTSNSIFGPCGGVTLPHDDWVRAEALLWWTKGSHIPPLLTTSPDGTPNRKPAFLTSPALKCC